MRPIAAWSSPSAATADPIALVAVQGPNARAKAWQVLPTTTDASEQLKPFNAVIVKDAAFGEVIVARTGYTGEDGFELGVPSTKVEALWNALAAAGVKPAGLGARDTLRLEAGMNLYGQDMDETVSPLDAGLGWTVAWNRERDFIGRAALTAQKSSGVPQKIGLPVEDRAVLRAHQKVTLEGVGDGESRRTRIFSPTMQHSIALARVPQRTGDACRSRSATDWSRPGRTAPFVRNGKVHRPLISPLPTPRRTARSQCTRRTELPQVARMGPPRSRRHDYHRHHRSRAAGARRPRVRRTARSGPPRARRRCLRRRRIGEGRVRRLRPVSGEIVAANDDLTGSPT